MPHPDETRDLPAPPTASRVGDARTAGYDGHPTGTHVPTPEESAAAARSGHAPIPGYEVLGKIGEGGMGVVYRARQLGLNREVAVKQILSASVPRSALARFWAEAEVMAAVRHPHVVQVIELGEHAGRPFIAMEYCPGGSLADRLRGAAPVPPRATAELVERIARGVAAAHDLGIVHRDLKPGNVLLAADGTPKVADFGLAKRTAHDLTATQAVMGTPFYMAPEQAAGRAKFVGPPADVWALGVILYECVAGARPFAADSVAELLSQIQSAEPIALRTRARGVPRDLDTIVGKCLAKEPEHRYPTAAELADDLGRFVCGEPILARPVGTAERLVRWVRREPKLAAAAGTVAALLVAVAVVSVVASVRERDLRGQAETDRGKAEEAEKAAVAALAEEKRLTALADDRLRDLRRETVNLSYTQGLSLCENGDAARGLLWLARGYEQAGAAGLADLRATGRTLLDGWSRDVHRLRLMIPVEGPSRMVMTIDGRVVITAGGGRGEVRRWDAVTGKPIGGAMVHGTPVTALAVTGDGSVIFSGGANGSGQLWDVGTGKPLTTDIHHAAAVDGAAFSPDGRRLVTGDASKDAHTKVWDVATGKQIGQPVQHGHRVPAIDFSPDGKTYLTASWDRSVTLWDSETGQKRGATHVHHGLPHAVAFARSGEWVAVGTTQGEVFIWDTRTLRLARPVLKHEATVHCVAFSPDGRHLLSGSRDGTARLWDLRTGRPVGAPLPHRSTVIGVGFAPGGRFLTAGLGSPIRAWEWGERPGAVDVYAPSGAVLGAAPSPDGRVVVVGLSSRTARPWDAVTGRPLAPPVEFPAPVHGVAYSGDGLWVAVACEDRKVHIVDARTWTRTDVAVDAAAGLLEFAPTGSVLLTAATDRKTAHLRAAPSGRPVGRPLAHPGGLQAVAFSPDGTRVLTGGRDGTARLWDAATGLPVGEPLPHRGGVRAVAFSRDGARALIGGGSTAVLWDLASGRPVGAPLPHPAELLSLALSPDGRTALTGCEDGTGRLWDLGRSGPIGPPLRHGAPIAVVTFEPGGAALTGSTDGTVRAWDSKSGRAAGPSTSFDGQVRRMWLSPDGRRLVVLTGRAAHVRAWGLPGRTPAETDWKATAEALTGMRLDQSGSVHLLDHEEWGRRLGVAAPRRVQPGREDPGQRVLGPDRRPVAGAPAGRTAAAAEVTAARPAIITG